jgi:ATP-dependent helicase Lhr and Lhr-like helicase
LLDTKETSYNQVQRWFENRGWQPFDFQLEAWKAYDSGLSGLVNAPTGSGKTYSLLVPALIPLAKGEKGLRILWVTPIRALAKEIELSARRIVEGLDWPIDVGSRTGDTPTAVRARQKRSIPQVLITTPESIHVLFAQTDYQEIFGDLDAIIVDEWHELIGSKRGVQMELAISRLRSLSPGLKIWGISATIGNLEQAVEVLLGPEKAGDGILIRSFTEKEIEVKTLLPDDISTMPWSGHIGIKMVDKVLPVIRESSSTLIFTNTRAQCEIWFHRLLDHAPDLAGTIAMHHGSISRELRSWVEDALYNGDLKAVVCTSSLDLGVDFRPVETIVQVGGPKGVARFIQRAGRSGHQPGAASKIYFLPTHSLELIEAAALRQAVKENYLEDRVPYVLSFDVLIQYLMTLAVSCGFNADSVLAEIRNTYSFSLISDEEWRWCLRFFSTGGASLGAYPQFKKAELIEGSYVVADKKIARRHKLSIGTIVGDHMLVVKYNRGANIGNIEESFVSRILPGQTFWFAGRNLELIRIKDMAAIVKNSGKKSGRVAVWGGGRLSFSSHMSDMLRRKLTEVVEGRVRDVELLYLKPLIEIQAERSIVPHEGQLLIESFETDEGYHLVIFPFEGRLVHEGLAYLVAYRISLIQPMSFSMAFNDYGFELLSDIPIPLDKALGKDLFHSENVIEHLQSSINSGEMAGRKFRDIAIISGLVFRGYPGMPVRDRHLQSSSSLIYQVFQDHDPDNLLLRQAYTEVINHQLEMERFKLLLKRLKQMELVVTHPEIPTPFAFPIMADRLRQKMSTENVESVLERLSLDYS